jgi:hypothetical protein
MITVRVGWAMMITTPLSIPVEQFLQNPAVPPGVHGYQAKLSDSTVFGSPTEIVQALIGRFGKDEMPEAEHIEVFEVIGLPNHEWQRIRPKQ